MSCGAAAPRAEIMMRVKRFGIYLMASLVSTVSLLGAGSDALLADAAEKMDRARIRTLLQQRVDVNTPQVDGMTALHWATYQDDRENAALLVSAGANVKAVNRYGVTPLSLACTNGNAEIVELLLKAGADPNAALPGGETPLMTVSRVGSLASVKALLSRGATVDNKDDRRGQTALMWAAAEGHARVVEMLIEVGADLHHRLPSGFTPLLFAVREGRTDVVRVLLKAGADVNETVPVEGGRRRGYGGRLPPAGGRRRRSECQPARVHDPPCDDRGPQAGRRRQRSGSRRVRKHEQYRAREDARGAWREREREDDKAGELVKYTAQRARGDTFPAGCPDGGRRVDEDAGCLRRRSAGAECRQQHASDGGGRTRHAFARRGRGNRERSVGGRPGGIRSRRRRECHRQ